LPGPRLAASLPRMKTTTVLVLALLGTAPALAEEPKADPKKPTAQYAVFETSLGKIGVRLLPQVAPNAVRNFVELAQGTKGWTDPVTGKPMKAPLYDGTLFHRVISGFMIQGGDPLTRNAPFGATSAANGMPFGMGDPGYKFDDELQVGTRPFDVPCQLAMANSGPNTNGSQFFITEGTPGHLNPKPAGTKSGAVGYVHFGEGVCGCELTTKIARAGNGQVRLEKLVITSTPPTCK
jgi:peptidyl-prolyl cis-trans isomerase A (cyclophilin A)